MADGVLGMDLLRAALASSATALEAVDFICGFTEENGQGGNGAYKGKLIYSNSYIVSDREEAFVVETAGRRWAWRRIEDLAAISNAYSIEEDYKRLDARTRKEIAPVNERAACSDEADPGRKGRKESWRAHVERRIYLRFTKGDLRRATVLSRLEAARGRAGFSSILAVLREHGGFNPLWGSRHMEGICMHAGGLLNNATTASMLVAYPARPQDPLLVWFSGTSYPCRSLYKPVLLDDGAFKPLWTEYDYAEDSSASYEYWNRQRAWIRETRSGARIPDAAFVARRDAAQGSIAEAAAAVAAGGNPVPEKARINAAVREWQTALPGRR
jgi:secernin